MGRRRRRLDRRFWISAILALAFAPAAPAAPPDRPDPTLARLDGPSGVAVMFSDGGDVHRLAAGGTRLLTAGTSGARVWDAATFQPLAEPVRFDGVARAAVISADGRTAAAAVGQTAVVWAADAAAPAHVLPHPDVVLDVAFARDSSRLATGCADGVARVWDAATGKLIAELRHEGGVRAVQFGPDGAKLLTAAVDLERATRLGRQGMVNLTPNADARVALWDVAASRWDWQLMDEPERRDPRPILCGGRPALSADGRRVAVPGVGVRGLYLIDAATGKPTSRWLRQGTGNPVLRVVEFSRTGDRLLAAGDVVYWDGEDPQPAAVVFRVRDGQLGEPSKVARTRDLDFRAAALSPRGDRVALAAARWHAHEELAGFYEPISGNFVQRFEPRPPFGVWGEAGERVLTFDPSRDRIAVGYVHERAGGERVEYTMVWDAWH